MKLNPDCVRDILLTAEENCDFLSPWDFHKGDSIDRLNSYSHEEIAYHIRQCELSRLLEAVEYCDGGDWITITDLTPDGHKFLADIRSDTVWKDVKEVSQKVGSSSLSSLSKIATGIISAIIKSHLGIT